MIIRKKKDHVDENNKSLWYSLEVDFKNLTGDEFEKLLGELYQRQGYRVTKSIQGADNGIDLMATRGNTSVIIQAKNWKGKVSNGDILKTSGARLMYNANYAMVITSSHFTDSAKHVIENSPRIRGMEIESLQKKVREYFKKEIKKPKEGTLITKIKNKITWTTKPELVEMEFNIREGKIEQIPFRKPNSIRKNIVMRSKNTINRKTRRNYRKSRRF